MERQQPLLYKKEIRPLPQRRVSYSHEKGFDTGQHRLDGLLQDWWNIFTTLAQTPSESRGDMGPIRGKVKDFYAQQAFLDLGVTQEDIKNGPLVITMPGIGEGKILSSHLDTVTPGNAIVPYIDREIVRSEGSQILGADNKYPTAVILAVTKFITENNISHTPLRLIFTCDEETDSVQITRAPIGNETMAFIADKSGSLGSIVVASGGYTGISAEIKGLTDERALEFIDRLAENLGSNHVGRRPGLSNAPEDLLKDIPITLDEITLGENNSRNIIASEGYITGTISSSSVMDLPTAQKNLLTAVSPIGADVTFIKENDNTSQFKIIFRGVAGHTTKPGTAEENGTVSSLHDAFHMSRMLLGNKSFQESASEDSDDIVQVNIGNMHTSRRGAVKDLRFSGEARYLEKEGALGVLANLEKLVKEFGGTIEITEENKAYQLDPNSKSVLFIQDVLSQNGYQPELVTSLGVSDANNAPSSWNTVVISDGSENPHRPDESISLENVVGLLNIFYDLATNTLEKGGE